MAFCASIFGWASRDLCCSFGFAASSVACNCLVYLEKLSSTVRFESGEVQTNIHASYSKFADISITHVVIYFLLVP